MACFVVWSVLGPKCPSPFNLLDPTVFLFEISIAKNATQKSEWDTFLSICQCGDDDRRAKTRSCGLQYLQIMSLQRTDYEVHSVTYQLPDTFKHVLIVPKKCVDHNMF